MSDQTWALIVGAATVVALRVIDFVLPKGWHIRWPSQWVTHDNDDDDSEPA